MKKILKSIPNTLTLLNAFCGCLACMFAFEACYLYAAFAVLLAAVFDFFDGFAARMLDAHSSIGKDLDSLADMVSFGVAPGFVIFNFLTRNAFIVGYEYLAYIAFLIPLFSALRLAKFNVDERQTTSFIGLPTPANSIFWIFTVYLMNKTEVIDSMPKLIVVFFLVMLFSYLLVAEIPMFSLKFKTFGWKENKLRYIFLVLSLALILILQIGAFPLIIGLYIILSLLNGRN